jgi:hypothetical protein
VEPVAEEGGFGRAEGEGGPSAAVRAASTGPAQRIGATPAQVALAWLLRRSPAMVVIPGTTNPDHLSANIAAAEVAEKLTDTEVTRLNRPRRRVQGRHRPAAPVHPRRAQVRNGKPALSDRPMAAATSPAGPRSR